MLIRSIHWPAAFHKNGSIDLSYSAAEGQVMRQQRVAKGAAPSLLLAGIGKEERRVRRLANETPSLTQGYAPAGTRMAGHPTRAGPTMPRTMRRRVLTSTVAARSIGQQPKLRLPSQLTMHSSKSILAGLSAQPRSLQVPASWLVSVY
jgi:hypothetical protein